MAIRVKERAGTTKPLSSSYAFPERREPMTSSCSSWCDESRMTPDRTAAYLHKLTRLRDNLLQTESANLTNAISRTLQPAHHMRALAGHVVPQPLMRRHVAVSVSSGPGRHHRMQMEKMAEIERRRAAACKSPPPMMVAVRAIEDPVRPKKMAAVKVKENIGNDPFDASALEPIDPMEKLFNMERIRLLNTMAAKQDHSAPPTVKARIKPVLRQGNLLSPRRGDEWFITGRYKKEEKKSHNARIHKGSMHRKNRKHDRSQKHDALKPENVLDTRSNTLEVDALRSDSNVEQGTIPPLATPAVWDQNQPLAVDSTANLMNAIASTAEANKADVRAKVFQYDPNNYKPIGTPMTSPRSSSRGPASSGRHEDGQRSKAIAAVLHGNIDENTQSYQNYESSAVSKRAPVDPLPANRGRKGSIQAGFKGHRTAHHADDAIKVPSLATSPLVLESIETEAKPQQPISMVNITSKVEMVENLPKATVAEGDKNEALFVPASDIQPQINLREASPDSTPRKEEAEVSLKKIFRQNELREKEVNNLFEDIKELNKISESLKAENNLNVKE